MPNLISKQDLVLLYVMIDDALKQFSLPKFGRPSILSDSEMMTILIYNTLLLHQKNLKDILNFVSNYHDRDFPRLPKYSTFVEHANRLIPLMGNILSLTLAFSEINFTDSTMLEVCTLRRAENHKVAQNVASFGKNHQGWHFGFKLHAAINPQKQFSAFCFSPANVYDAQMLPKLVKQYMKILVGDSHYGARVMAKHIWEKHHILIIAPPHYKQKTKLTAWWQTVLLSARSKIESVFDILKEHMNLVTSFPRSVAGYFLHYLRVLLAYQFSFLLHSSHSTQN